MSRAFRSDSLPHVTAAAILTGGRARRFHGRDKSRLPAFPGGPTILEHQLAALAPIVSEILIVTSAERAADFAAVHAASPARTPVRVVVDSAPDHGPLGAIVTALEATAADAIAVVAGDMPGLTGAFVAALLRLHDAAGTAITAVETTRGLEPLAAIYGRAARPALARALAAGELSLQRALQTVPLNRVGAAQLASFGDVDALFRNINTPEDLHGQP